MFQIFRLNMLNLYVIYARCHYALLKKREIGKALVILSTKMAETIFAGFLLDPKYFLLKNSLSQPVASLYYLETFWGSNCRYLLSRDSFIWESGAGEATGILWVEPRCSWHDVTMHTLCSSATLLQRTSHFPMWTQRGCLSSLVLAFVSLTPEDPCCSWVLGDRIVLCSNMDLLLADFDKMSLQGQSYQDVTCFCCLCVWHIFHASSLEQIMDICTGAVWTLS